jgi:hypothetical protein
MSESVTAVNSGGSSGVTEHSFKRRVPGDIASVRQRMIDALESFEYVILSEDPLVARRDGSFSFNVLDCGLKVGIVFRRPTPTSTIATFNYVIPLSMVTKGDLHTVEREADALIALATRPQTAAACVTCGTNNSADSRFCRGCGAPNTGSLPAELEVMRLTAGARAGQQTIVAGVLVILSILPLALSLILFGRPKRETIGWVLLGLSQMVGWAVLLYGILRMHRTLNPKAGAQNVLPGELSRDLTANEHAALPPQSAWSSITEGTTELLDAQRTERTAVPIARTGPNRR